MTRKANNPIRRRIIGITLIGSMLICMLVSFISYYVFKNYLQDTMISSTLTNIYNLRDSINSDIESIYRFSRFCQTNTDIANYVSTRANNSVRSVKTYDRLYEEYRNNESSGFIPRAAIIKDQKYLHVCQTTNSTTKNLATNVPELSFYQELLDSKGYDFSVGFIPEPFMYKASIMVVPIIRPIANKFNSARGGVLYMEISSDLFTSAMDRFMTETNGDFYLIMGEHVYKYDGTLTELETPVSNPLVKSSYTTKEKLVVTEYQTASGNQTVVKAPLSMNDCYILQAISPDILNNGKRAFLFVLIGILIFIIAIWVALNVAFNHYVYEPLTAIREKISRTALGDFSRDPSIEWNHELGEVGQGINDLSVSIDQLLQSRLKDEKEKQDLEYQMLQSQINPHFLYNTLNSIKMMAIMQGSNGIADMTTALASLLRSISKGTSLLIPIKEELSLVKDYFTIQNYRYGGMIDFNVTIDDNALTKYSILKFTLQPLVENAIFHGLEPKGGSGTITVHLYSRSENDLILDVTDDGVGIPQEAIERLLTENSSEKAEFFKEIGISNVNKRLQYEFGDKYGISIESEVDHFTTMRVIIPRRENDV